MLNLYDWSSLWILLPVCFLASFSRSTLGFGDALIAMPLLNLAFELDDIRPLVALVSIFVAAGILIRDKRSLQVRSALRLIPFALIGVPLGLSVNWLPTSVVKAVLACIIIGFCWVQLTKPKLAQLRNDRLAPFFGFGAGILGGAYNTQGPLLVIYGALRRWTPDQFRATMQGFFLPTSAAILVGHWATGNLTSKTLLTFVWILPVVLITIPLGAISLKYIDAKKFRIALNAFLLVAGVALLIQAIMPA